MKCQSFNKKEKRLTLSVTKQKVQKSILVSIQNLIVLHLFHVLISKYKQNVIKGHFIRYNDAVKQM